MSAFTLALVITLWTLRTRRRAASEALTTAVMGLTLARILLDDAMAKAAQSVTGLIEALEAARAQERAAFAEITAAFEEETP